MTDHGAFVDATLLRGLELGSAFQQHHWQHLVCQRASVSTTKASATRIPGLDALSLQSLSSAASRAAWAIGLCVGCVRLARPSRSPRRGVWRGDARTSRNADNAEASSSAAIIDGKAIAASLRQELRSRVDELRAARSLVPGLAVILVGQRPDSQAYVRNKTKAAEEVGIRVFDFSFPEDVLQQMVMEKIRELNLDKSVHGILVQLPLPDGMDEAAVLGAISDSKDVDGLSAKNIGSLAQRESDPLAIACTPSGCMELLRRSGVDVAGKHCVVLGRSTIVGVPMALLLLRANATVTILHSHSQDVPGCIGRADVVVAAIGRPGFVQGDWLKEGCAVLDVGINRVPDSSKKSGYRLTGDVDFESARLRAAAITPVPGGVGPMTVAMLLKNTVDLAVAADTSGR